MVSTVIGVGGVSCGGKTTLAKQLVLKLQSLPSVNRVSVLHQDDFYKDEETLFRENVFYDKDLKYHNWELPACFDGERFRKDFGRLLPKTDDDENNPPTSSNANFIILEGILIFEDTLISSAMTKRYFLHLPLEECRQRRSKRNYLPPEPDGYFDKYYWPSYVEQKARIDGKVGKGDLEMTYLDSEKENIDELVARIMDDIKDVIPN